MKTHQLEVRKLFPVLSRLSYSAFLPALLISLALVFGAKAGVEESSKTLSSVNESTAAARHVDAQEQQIVDWLAERDFQSLTVSQLQWSLQKLLSDSAPEQLKMTWTGLLKPPYTGSYQFSVSPIDVNQASLVPVEHRITVKIGHREILNTSPNKVESEGQKEQPRQVNPSIASPSEAWQWEGQPIELQANVPVPMKVIMTYVVPRRGDGNRLQPASPSALLFWKGPGLHRQIVGDSFLTHGKNEPGLQTEYRWPSDLGERVVVQQSERVDFAWSSLASATPGNLPLLKRLTARLFELATSPAYLQTCIRGETQHVYFADSAGTDYLSTDQRQQFLQLLLGSPELLERIEKTQIAHVYQRFRFGVEEEALDVLGSWLSLRPNITPQLSLNFFQDNRQVYWELASLLTQQLPDRVEALRNNYLETTDGSCVLPVAYTLSYTGLAKDSITRSALARIPRFERKRRSEQRQASKGQYETWIELLDERLAGDSLSGDVRVNWLLARSLTTEINGQPILYQPLAGEELLAGRGWLDEGKLVADTAQTQNRLGRELVARMAAYQMWEAADSEVAALPSPVEQTALRRQLKPLETAAKSLLAAQRRRSLESRVAEFERRKQKAVDRGEETAVSRYTAKIEQLRTAVKQSTR